MIHHGNIRNFSFKNQKQHQVANLTPVFKMALTVLVENSMKKKSKQMEKEEVVLPLCEDYMIVYIGKPGKSMNKLLESMQFQ